MVSKGPIRQTDFGAAVGISQQAVSDLVNRGVLTEGEGADVWLLAYCHRLREQAAGRMGHETGGLDLAQERAALAREQRQGLEIRNATLRGEFASITLLAEVLANASQAVAERFDHLPGLLKKAAPDLPEAARQAVMTVIATARNDWSRETAQLVATRVLLTDDDLDTGDTDEPRAD